MQESNVIEKSARDTFKSILSLEISEQALTAILAATKHKEGFLIDILDSIILGCVLSLMSICEAHDVDYNQEFIDEAVKNMRKCMDICHQLRQDTN